jgi:hypothetical protein
MPNRKEPQRHVAAALCASVQSGMIAEGRHPDGSYFRANPKLSLDFLGQEKRSKWNVRFWPKADITSCIAHVRFRGTATVFRNPLLRSLLGVKRTSLFAAHMSASDPKRTWAGSIISL